MKILRTTQRRRKLPGSGFEILRRLRGEKAHVEARMSTLFDLTLSLRLDQVIMTIESLQGSGGAAW